MTMHLSYARHKDRFVVYASGTLDERGAEDLAQHVNVLLEAEDVPVVIDLADVTTIEEISLPVLDHMFAAADEPQTTAPGASPQLRISPHLQPAVRDVFTQWGGRLAQSPMSPATAAPASYSQLLEQVRQAFPSPISDRDSDKHFIGTVEQALEWVDALKTHLPYLGELGELDYAAARRVTLGESMVAVDDAIASMVQYLHGLVIWGHKRTQYNVGPPTTIPSIIGQMMSAIYNPNAISDESAQRVALAEVEVAAMCAGLVGYDPKRAAGVFTFGGTGTELYALKLGIEKAVRGEKAVGSDEARQGAFCDGIRDAAQLCVVASDVSHNAKMNIAAWLGIGSRHVHEVSTDRDNSMNIAALETTLRERIEHGDKIACIIATMGSTDAFGIDNLGAITRLRDRLVTEYRLTYRPHVHADAVIGWAWSVFKTYDFNGNPLGFSKRTARSLKTTQQKLRTLHLADSIGIDFHKTGYAPYICSLLLVKSKRDLHLIAHDPKEMPYIYHHGKYHPGMFTLEVSRSGGAALAALANLKLLGLEGYRVLLGHTVTMAELLREQLEHGVLRKHAVVLNDYNHGPVTLFRLYPDGVNPREAYEEEIEHKAKERQLKRHNDYNQRVFGALHDQLVAGDGPWLGKSNKYRVTSYGAPIVALKSYVMSPFVDDQAMSILVKCIERARAAVARGE